MVDPNRECDRNVDSGSPGARELLHRVGIDVKPKGTATRRETDLPEINSFTHPPHFFKYLLQLQPWQDRPPAVSVADPPELVERLPPQLVPQQSVHAHGGAGRVSLGRPHRDVRHLPRRRDLVHDPRLQRLGGREAMRLQQDPAGHSRVQFQSDQRADAVEVQTQIDGGQAPEPAFGVHDAVVAGQGEWAGAAEGVARQERDGGEGVVDQRGQERVEAVVARERVARVLVQLDARAPEFGGGARDHHAPRLAWADGDFDVA